MEYPLSLLDISSISEILQKIEGFYNDQTGLKKEAIAAAVGFFAGVAGTVIGIILKHYLEDRPKSRKELTYSISREFFSKEMLRARREADSFFIANPGICIKSYYAEKPEDLDPVWEVMEFYQRLWVAVNARDVDNKVVVELFAENYTYWYTQFFEDCLRYTTYTDKDRLRGLFNFFKDNVPDDTIEQWKVRAKDDVRERIAKRRGVADGRSSESLKNVSVT